MDYLKEIKKLKKKTTITCILPAWNEGRYIEHVLKVITKFPYFDEIVVVDDGSDDNTTAIAKKYKKAKVITHKVNKGKTAAVLTGVDNSKGDIITLIDADLIGLTHEYIAKLLYYILKGEYDMTILDRQGDREAIWGWTNCARFVGGERAFWRKDFNQIEEVRRVDGYLIEIVVNLYYMDHNKKIKTLYCKDLYTVHQFNKIGKIKGYYNYFKVSKKYIEKATIRGYLKQIKCIEDEHKEIKHIEKKERKKDLFKGIKKRIGSKQYKEAEKEIKQQIKKQKIPTRMRKFRDFIKRKTRLKKIKNKVHEGTIGDLYEISQFNHKIFKGVYDQEPYSYKHYEQRLRNKTSYILLARAHRKLVANSIAYVEDNNLYIWILGVKKEFRKRGIASKLLELNEKYAKKYKLTAVTAKVYNVSSTMQTLHIKKGYLITKFKKGKNPQLNEVHFEKKLR
jgi:polyisoprenyl-phosphate glycosyltransferase